MAASSVTTYELAAIEMRAEFQRQLNRLAASLDIRDMPMPDFRYVVELTPVPLTTTDE